MTFVEMLFAIMTTPARPHMFDLWLTFFVPETGIGSIRFVETMSGDYVPPAPR